MASQQITCEYSNVRSMTILPVTPLQACQRIDESEIQSNDTSLSPESALVRVGSASSFQSESPHHDQIVHIRSAQEMRLPDASVNQRLKRVDPMELLKSILEPDQLYSLGFEEVDFNLLRNATIDPPVTKASLSELDLARIVNDPKLRHDLLFEKDVSFRPNYDGERGKQKKALAKKYWTALAVELALYMPREGCENLTSYMEAFSAEKVPLRLPIMFRTIQEILKTLVRGEDVASVDQILDVPLLMQQLKKGACDLINLGEWLGVMLKGSCSPVRDEFITTVVQQIRRAATRFDPCALALAIEQLFGILETMKLDVANHQIRHIRLLMIMNGVQHEQNYFLSQIDNGLDVTTAVKWLENSLSKGIHSVQKPNSPLFVLSNAIIELITNTSHEMPVTLQFDRERLLRLRIDFQQVMFQAAISETFVHLLRHLGYAGSVNQKMLGRLHYRIHQLNPSLSITAAEKEFPSFPIYHSLILEVTRAAYEVCNLTTVPVTADLAFTWKHIATLLDATIGGKISASIDNTISSERLDVVIDACPKKCSPRTIKSRLCETFEGVVQDELLAIASQAPLDILSRYEASSGSSISPHCPAEIKARNTAVVPAPTIALSSPTCKKSRRGSRSAMRGSEGSDGVNFCSENIIRRSLALEGLARRIAHISVVHWRVWGPILYTRSPGCAADFLVDNKRSKDFLQQPKGIGWRNRDMTLADQDSINHEKRECNPE